MSACGDILTAVKTLVSAITGLTTANQVVIRKRLAFLKQTDSAILQAGLSFVCIAPTGEILHDSHMANTDQIEYRVTVVIIRESKMSLIDYETTLLLRQQIRQKLRVPTLSGTTAFKQESYNPEPQFSLEGYDNNLDVSAQEFGWVVTETRNQ